VRPTPARLLREGSLVVDFTDVHKVTKVEYPLPQQLVTVRLTNQMTGYPSSCDLRWDQLITTEDPLEIEIGLTGTVRVELARLADNKNPTVYRWRVTDEGVDYQGTDIHLRVGQRADNEKAMGALLSFLGTGGEAYRATMGDRKSDNADMFPPDINEWAYQHSEEISMAHLRLSGGLER